MADYAGISVFDVMQLNVFVYWTLLHDAVVYMYSKTEARCGKAAGEVRE